jgi:GT2 family glycosyltransferase
MVMGIEKIRLGDDVTIGMSAFGNYQTTSEALNSLFISAEGEFELLLVDDCSPDNTLSLFQETKRRYPHTKVLSFDRNLEYSGSLNAIFSHAKGRWVLFLSNDILVTPAYLRELFQIARSDPTFGIVRGCSNFVDNERDTHNIKLPSATMSLEQMVNFGEEHASRFRGQSLSDDYLTGDAFMVSRAVLDKIGTLDPMFFGYFADHDFGVRAKIAGFKLVLARAAFAFHKRDANFTYLPEQLRNQKMTLRWMRIFENWARFKLKYGLPVELPFTSLNNLNWEALCQRPFNPETCYVSPGDYSKYFR